MSELLQSYINGNYSWARDEFWGSTKEQMRDYMLEANEEFNKNELHVFIRVIFLP